MKKFFQASILTCFILIQMVTMTGCWNRRELTSMAIVVGVAIDQGEKKGTTDVVTQIVKPTVVKNAWEGGSGENAYWNLHLSGTDLFQTLRSATHLTDRKLYIAHNQFVIFGRQVAEEGLDNYLDYFFRDHETRYTVWMMVADGKASDILDTPSQLELMPALNINKLLEVQGANSQTPRSNIFDFVTAYESSYTCAVMPIIRLEKVHGQHEKDDACISGGAVFRKDRMIGELDETETRGLLWAKNGVQSGVIAISLQGESASIEVLRSETKRKIHQAEDGHIVVKLSVHLEGTLDNVTTDVNVTDMKIYDTIRQKASKNVEDEIEQSINKAKELNADIYGLGEYLERHYPTLWKKLEDHWLEEFPKVEFQISVDSSIGNTGMLINPVEGEEMSK